MFVTAVTTGGKPCVTAFYNVLRVATPALHNHGAERRTRETPIHALTFSRNDLPSLVAYLETPPDLPSPVASAGNTITTASLSAAWPRRVWMNDRNALQHVLHV